MTMIATKEVVANPTGSDLDNAIAQTLKNRTDTSTSTLSTAGTTVEGDMSGNGEAANEHDPEKDTTTSTGGGGDGGAVVDTPSESIPLGPSNEKLNFPAMSAVPDGSVETLKGDGGMIVSTKPRPAPIGTSASKRLPTLTAIRVIKSEIHNVLTVMRADQRYYSASRFVEESEEPPHPVAVQLQELHARLLVEYHMEDCLEPFCQAVEGADISAPVTGAALAALHKFLMYGFLEDSPVGLKRIAFAVLKCSFEEDSTTTTATVRKSITSASIVNPQSNLSSTTVGSTSTATTATSKSHHPSSSGGSMNSSTIAHHVRGVSSSISLHHLPYDDEQTVLQLLNVAVATVRCSLELPYPDQQLDSATLVELWDACLHVSHRAQKASPLLKSAAYAALNQVVVLIFSSLGGPIILEARQEILLKLAKLLNPIKTATIGPHTAANSRNSSTGSGAMVIVGGSSMAGGTTAGSIPDMTSVIASSLSLVNIALETCREPLTDAEIHIVQNDLCKYLLQWSSSSQDWFVLSLTLRVVFNLFQSIRNHLKVPLEVILTSVHLRILDRHEEYWEEREVALEGLLEFCQEPALMQDIYLNYDCDVACSNLYESIVRALAHVIVPDSDDNEDQVESNLVSIAGTELGGGSLLLTGSTDKNAAGSQTTGSTTKTPATPAPERPSTVVVSQGGPPDPASQPPVTQLQRLAFEGLLWILDSIATRCQEFKRLQGSSTAPPPSNATPNSCPPSLSYTEIKRGVGRTASTDSMDSTFDDALTDSQSLHRQVSSEELQVRKQKKHSLIRIARAFNADPMSSEWLNVAVNEGLLDLEDEQPSKDNKQSNETEKKKTSWSVGGVARLLHMAPTLDKTKLGIYLSKGPEKDYPFQAKVRDAYVARYVFQQLPFAAALRKYLSKFRLPGEAQCIDRLMEAFSRELYKQQGESSFFKNSDAAYVLSFSTIMLNTDLHNPTIKEDDRMTIEQFVRNNRGINGGEDLPETFLRELYDQIKVTEIQVRRELGDFMKKHEHEDFRSAWESILAKNGEVAEPFFSPAGQSSSMGEGFHDKEMFLVLSKPAVQAFASIFARSWDDSLVVRALTGIQTIVKVAVYFELDVTINDVLEALLPLGTEYVIRTIYDDYANLEADGTVSISVSRKDDESGGDDETATYMEDDHQPVPLGLLSSSKSTGEIDITGSASHRGLLAMDCSFTLIRKHAARVDKAWPSFIECLCALRDCSALPPALADLDDFADSNGNVLPLSSFNRKSSRRLDEHFRSHSRTEERKGWFTSFFRKKPVENEVAMNDDDDERPRREISAAGRTLLSIAESADVESVIQLGSTKLAAAERVVSSLLSALDDFPFISDPVGEQHAIFKMELGARALLSNRERATDLFNVFLTKFESILGRVSEKRVPAPFVIERIVVTILRACIHLFDVEELRPSLRASLHLIMMSLPKSYIKLIADRMACGFAIILRASYSYFEGPNEWTFMGDNLDTLAHYPTSRVFVFDGIASTVEYALPYSLVPEDSKEDEKDIIKEEVSMEDRPKLSKDATNSLSRLLLRFVLGFYQGDSSLAVPAMLCLEKVYRHRVQLLLTSEDSRETKADPASYAPDKEHWQNVAVALYTACRSSDPEISGFGVQCYRRVVVGTSVDQITDDKWLDILFLMANKQPLVTAEVSRGNSFSVLGQVMAHVLPHLSLNKSLRDDLVDLVNQVATLARENLRQGRRGSVSPLFEKTLQTMTYLSNHMMSDEWTGESEFSSWASETLLAELERVGAAGASLKYQQATLPLAQRQGSSNNDEEKTSEPPAPEAIVSG